MDGDDRSKTALGAPNRDDVLVFGTGQTLRGVACIGRGQATHDEILLAIRGRAALGSTSTRRTRTGRVASRLGR